MASASNRPQRPGGKPAFGLLVLLAVAAPMTVIVAVAATASPRPNTAALYS